MNPIEPRDHREEVAHLPSEPDRSPRPLRADPRTAPQGATSESARSGSGRPEPRRRGASAVSTLERWLYRYKARRHGGADARASLGPRPRARG